MLLIIGIALESTHLRRWKDTRNRCSVVRRGSFLAAGLFDLWTVFLATAFYLVVLQMKRVKEGEAAVQREVVEAARFSTPGSSTSNMILVSTNEGEDSIEQSPVMDRVGIDVKASNLQ